MTPIPDGLVIPAPHPAVGSYAMAVSSGDLIFLSGHGCFDNATPIHVGKLGADLTTEQGRQAARAVALNLLATTIDQVGDLSRVAQVVKMVVFVNSTPDFTEQHLVANGATDLLIEVLGGAGRTARSAIGVASLPLGFAVEIEAVIRLTERGSLMTDTFEVVVSRILPVPPEQAWHAWSDADLVRQWWGPTGFSCPSADVDLRVGGRALVAMRAPAEFGGADMYSTWTYTEVVPHSRIAYVFNFADPQGNRLVPADLGMPPGIPDDVEHAVIFEDLDDGRTVMTIVEQGYTLEEARDLSQEGLEQCVDKMAAIFAADR